MEDQSEGDFAQKLSEFFDKFEILELSLEGVEAKEICLAYHRQRQDDPDEVIAAKAAEFTGIFQKSKPSDFEKFVVFTGLGWARGKVTNLALSGVVRGLEPGLHYGFEDYMIIPVNTESKYYRVDTEAATFPFSYGPEYLKATVMQLIEIFGRDWLINKAAERLFIKYSKFISVGQARGVIKRTIGKPLTSTERSQLHEFRKKLNRCKRVLADFEELVLQPPAGVARKLKEELYEAFKSTLKQQNQIDGSITIGTSTAAPVLRAGLKCETCGRTRELPHSLLENDETVSLPRCDHCNGSMRINITGTR